MATTHPRFEEKFWEQIADAICPNLKFKKPSPSILLLGGGQWRFGKMVEQRLEAKSLVYATDETAAMNIADENGVLSTLCDVSNLEQIQTLGKYEAALIKGTFERMAGTVEKLEDYFFALYKLVKLRGKVIFIVRFRPTLPLPAKVLEKWTETLPDRATFKSEAEECGFTVEQATLKFPVEGLTVEEYAEVLRKGQLPFLDAVSPEELEEFIKSLKSPLKFDDEYEYFTLIKLIT